MNRESYDFEKHEDSTYAYAFLSVGAQGTITKVVYFQEISQKIYNLAMGDATDDADKPIDDMKVSNNGDMPKVMATIAQIMVKFLELKPHVSILVEGNTPTKKALYQRIVTNNIQDLAPLFVILGIDAEGNILSFDSQTPYEALIIKLNPLT